MLNTGLRKFFFIFFLSETDLRVVGLHSLTSQIWNGLNHDYIGPSECPDTAKHIYIKMSNCRDASRQSLLATVLIFSHVPSGMQIFTLFDRDLIECVHIRTRMRIFGREIMLTGAKSKKPFQRRFEGKKALQAGV